MGCCHRLAGQGVILINLHGVCVQFGDNDKGSAAMVCVMWCWLMVSSMGGDEACDLAVMASWWVPAHV